MSLKDLVLYCSVYSKLNIQGRNLRKFAIFIFPVNEKAEQIFVKIMWLLTQRKSCYKTGVPQNFISSQAVGYTAQQ